jgi:hypothetical protein
VGIGACALVLAAALGTAYWATQQPVGLGMFGGFFVAVAGLALSLLVAVWTYGYYTLRYALGQDGVTIDWLFHHEQLPYSAIDALYSGQRLTEALRVRGINWPGYYVGRARARSLGVLRVFASTLDRGSLTILLTDLGGYVLSPDPTFRTELIEHLERVRGDGAGPAPPAVRPLRATPLTIGPVSRPRQLTRALADPWLLAGALASLCGVLAMLGLIMDRYESLPELVAQRPRFELFHLPSVGASVLLLDVLLGMWVYEREPYAARLLWAAPLLVQAVLLVALLRLLG